MARVAFINIPAHGHTNPTVPLVAELVRQGEEVVYYTFPPFRAALERAGAQVRTYADEVALNVLRRRLWRSSNVITLHNDQQ